MKLLRGTPFEVVHFGLRHTPGAPSRTVVVKATFRLVRAGVCPVAATQRFPSGELHHDDDVERSLRHPDDLAPFKPRGECFVLGAFHAPHGQPVPLSRVAFRVGPVEKLLSIFGERRWTVGGPSQPTPTAYVPLVWELAHGGPDHPDNPVGCTRDRVPQIEHATELVTSARARVAPAGVAPIPRTWAARARRAGTYDAAYLRDAYPFYAPDFDWEYFCSAPTDQRIQGFWRGDEALSLFHLVPGMPQLDCRLPGLRARVGWVWAHDPARPEVTEVPLVLDTLTLDGDAGEVMALWRGTAREPVEPTHLLVMHQGLDEQVSMTQTAYRLLEAERASARAREAEPPPAAQRPGPAPAPEVPRLDAALARQAARVGGESAGLAPALVAGLGGASPPPPVLDEARLEALESEQRARRERSRSERRRFEERVARGEPLAGATLRGLDLTGLRLAGADLAGADLSDACLHRARLEGVSLRGAILDRADLSGARLERCSLEEATLVEASLEGALLEDCDLRRAVVEKTRAEGLRMVRCRASQLEGTGARWSSAHLDETDLTRANLAEAELSRATLLRVNLEDLHLEKADLSRARIEHCGLKGLRAIEVSAEELVVVSAHGPRSRWHGAALARAHFDRVDLTRADFSGAALTEACFSRAVLSRARFDGAALTRASLLSANLFQAQLPRADLSAADLRGANLFQAELFEARLEGARLELANLAGTRVRTP